MSEATMNAMIVERLGGPEVFTAARWPRPLLRPGHLLIRVGATSVNPTDCRLRSTQLPISPPLPAILHADVAGTVEQVGEGVTGFVPGDRVFACAGGIGGYSGALAEFMLADADLVARAPTTVDERTAAALPIVAITAWEALVERVPVTDGQRVLVHGAIGGVGHVAAQIARCRGAQVVGTEATAVRADAARDFLGVPVVDCSLQSVASYVEQYTGGEGFDVVLDSLGGPNLETSLEGARYRGDVVTIVATGNHDLSLAHSKELSLHAVFMLAPLLRGEGRNRHGRILTEVAKLVDEGRIVPLLDESIFHIADVAKAHARLESGDARGKIVLEA